MWYGDKDFSAETVFKVLGDEAKRYSALARKDNATRDEVKEALTLCVAIQDAARKICKEYKVDFNEVYGDFFQSY